MKKISDKQFRAHLTAILAVVIWGTSFISTKILLDYFSAVDITFVRFFIGYIVLCILSLSKARPKTLTADAPVGRFQIKREIFFAAAGLTGICLYFLMENIALSYTYASNTSMIVSTAPIFVALFAHFWVEGERIKPSFFAGFASAMLGIGLVSYSGSTVLKLNPLGDAFALAGAAVWGIYSILLKKISPFGFDFITLTRKTFFYGVAFLLPVVFVNGTLLNPGDWLNGQVWLHFLYLSAGASTLCYVVWAFSVDTLGATRCSAYIYLIPLVTVTTSAIVLNEKITPQALAGCALILSGLYLSERASTIS